MKKFFATALALSLVLSMTACGSKPSTASSAAPAPTASSAAPAPAPASSKPTAPAPAKPDPVADLKNPEYTPAQVATAEKFAAMTDRFNTLADTINADESLLAVTELVDTMNVLVEAINEDDALFADPANLTAEVLTNLEEGIVVANGFLDELDAMVANFSGKETITIPVNIINNTRVDLHGLAMSPANDDTWGSNLLDEALLADETGTTEMTFTADSLVWDLLAADAEGNTLSFMGLDFSEVPIDGAALVLEAQDGNYTAYFQAAQG